MPQINDGVCCGTNLQQVHKATRIMQHVYSVYRQPREGVSRRIVLLHKNRC